MKTIIFALPLFLAANLGLAFPLPKGLIPPPKSNPSLPGPPLPSLPPQPQTKGLPPQPQTKGLPPQPQTKGLPPQPQIKVFLPIPQPKGFPHFYPLPQLFFGHYRPALL